MLRILTLNTGLTEIRIGGIPFYTDVPHVNERAAHLAAALRSVNADIVALQELVPLRIKKALVAALADLYPYTAGLIEDGRFYGAGLLTLSRHPIDRASHTSFAQQTFEEGLFGPRGVVGCTVHVPGLGPCRVKNLHATAGGAYMRGKRASQDRRHAQIAEAASLANQAVEEIVILAGDFNSGPTAWPHIYEHVTEAGFNDTVVAADQTDDTGSQGTWDPANALNRKKTVAGAHRVDHVFLSRRGNARVSVARAEIVLREPTVPVSGGDQVPVSDHYGLLVELVAR
jgi:endonuclease/exonuclease/phosphatase family metal-dependent hydrolase